MLCQKQIHIDERRSTYCMKESGHSGDCDPAVNETQFSITNWADRVFGVPMSQSVLLDRVDKEYKELHAHFNREGCKNIGSEIADVIITLQRFAYYCGVNLQQAVNDKMKINRARKWKLDGKGCAQHIEESV